MNDHDYSLAPIQFDPFAGPTISKLIPVIEPQAEIWASCLLGGEDANRSYNESVSLRLQGLLNENALEKAIKELSRRHEILRAGMSADGKQLCIYEELNPEYHFSDISSHSPARQTEAIEAFLIEDAQTSFNLLTGPLFRVNLFRNGETDHHLTLSAHHIICDGWSMWVMLQDLGNLYSALVGGQVSLLDEAPSFSAYALGQKQFQSTEKYRQTEEYWLNQFKEDVPVLDIPTDKPRPENRTYKSRRDDYSLDPRLTEAIKKTGAAAGCSFVTTMLVSFEVFLHKISGQSDIVLGIPAAGQSLDNNQKLVGHCVNMLPLRSSPNGEERFIDYLHKRKTAILDAYEHQQLTFGSLLKKLNIPRNPSRIPLIPIVFNIDSSMDEGVRFEGLNYDIRINKREYENFEIFLNASLRDNDLTLEWSYNTQLFRPETIRRMMGDFESMLNAIVENPGSEIKDLAMKASAEFNRRLEKRNATQAAYPSDTPLHKLIEQAAAMHPERTALRFNHKTYTYRELNEISNRLAHHLFNNNLQKGDLAGLLLERSAEMLISILAILKCGAAYIPIDPEYPQKRIEYMLSDSSAGLLVTDSRFKGQFKPGIKAILIDEEADAINSNKEANPDIEADARTPAYVIYTSGSTGSPKGTIIEHRSLVNFLCSMQKSPGITPDDRLLSVTTISFDIAALELFLPLISGASVIIADSETCHDGSTLLEVVRSENISIMQATPSTWKMMIDAGWNQPLNLKILCGGEALSPDLAAKLLSLSTSLWNMYGPTETTVWSLLKEIKSGEEPITIGYPIDNTRVYILDQYLKPVMPGLAGEIHIAGDGLARSYLNRPELTARNFIPDPFVSNTDNKLYRTGDLGMFNEQGEIIFMGRIDNQIKLRGHRIEPDAIEHSLNMLEDIRECKVVLREDRPGDQRLAAYIVPKNTGQYLSDNEDYSTLSPSQTTGWKQQLGESLPSIMIPSEFVILRKIPLLPNGKTNRNALPVPESRDEGRATGRLPSTDIQKLIATAWAETLGLQSITLDDDFFELGGHSLIAAQLMIRLEKETGVRLPFTALFRHSSLEQFSSLFTQATK